MLRKKTALLPICIATTLGFHSMAKAEPYIGDMMLMGSYQCPRAPEGQWKIADGSLLNITDNGALFSLIGTNFGGDGTTTFALPDMRGRTPIGIGQGVGLSQSFTIGQTGGAEVVALTYETMPAHTHSFNASSAANDTHSAASTHIGSFRNNVYTSTPPVTGQIMNKQILSSAGHSSPLPVNNVQPSLIFTWCIAVTGLYPSRPD